MSKLRSISTSIWADTWIEDLNPTEKLLFIYLLTNEKTNMLGIYEISMRKMSFETGIGNESIKKALKTFEKSGRVKYIDNHIFLLNYLRHQNFNSNMKISAIDSYNNLPDNLKLPELTTVSQRDSKGFQRLCEGFGMLRKREYELEYELEEERESKEDFCDNDFYKDFDFFKDDFKKIWIDEFLPLKKKKKASISDRALKSQLDKVKKFSNNNYKSALEILEKSVDSGWSDIYELNNSSNEKNNRNNKDGKERFGVGKKDYKANWD